MVQIIGNFRPLSSRALTIQDREDGNGAEEYFGKFYGMIGTFCYDSQSTNFYVNMAPLFFCTGH